MCLFLGLMSNKMSKENLILLLCFAQGFLQLCSHVFKFDVDEEID